METTDFALYPNPTQNELNINLSHGAIEEVTIYDVTGQLVLRSVAGTASVDLSDLRSGLYFITVTTTDQKTFTDKIMKL